MLTYADKNCLKTHLCGSYCWYIHRAYKNGSALSPFMYLVQFQSNSKVGPSNMIGSKATLLMKGGSDSTIVRALDFGLSKDGWFKSHSRYSEYKGFLNSVVVRIMIMQNHSIYNP